MSHQPDHLSPVFQIDVSANGNKDETTTAGESNETTELLRALVVGQERQNELLEELVENMTASQRQRASELSQWKKANPALAMKCREAVDALSEVQSSFLTQLTEEIQEYHDSMLDGEFMLNEFVDRFGPRLAHLNGVMQVLSQLGSSPRRSKKG